MFSRNMFMAEIVLNFLFIVMLYSYNRWTHALFSVTYTLCVEYNDEPRSWIHPLIFQPFVFFIDLDRSAAATKLQALWRGYISRKREPVVVRARQEMRALRSEDHIRYLRKELDRFDLFLNHKLSTHDKHKHDRFKPVIFQVNLNKLFTSHIQWLFSSCPVSNHDSIIGYQSYALINCLATLDHILDELFLASN